MKEFDISKEADIDEKLIQKLKDDEKKKEEKEKKEEEERKLKEEEEMKNFVQREYWNSPGELEVAAERLIELMHQSTRTVVFTGDGISQQSNLNHFIKEPKDHFDDDMQKEDGERKMEDAFPSETHMALVALINKDMIYHIIT